MTFFLLVVLPTGLLYLLLKWGVIKVPTYRTLHPATRLEISTRNFGVLKIDLHATVIGELGIPADTLFVALASAALNQWALTWDGQISPETYSAIARLLARIPADDFRISRVIVAGLALPDAPKPKETPAQRARTTLDSAVETVQVFADFTGELSQKKDFWEDAERGGVIRKMISAMKNGIGRYDWRL